MGTRKIHGFGLVSVGVVAGILLTTMCRILGAQVLKKVGLWSDFATGVVAAMMVMVAWSGITRLKSLAIFEKRRG